MNSALMMIAVMTAVTYLTRALPFFVWGSKPCPPLIRYLGETLPYAMMGLLVVYAFKNVSLSEAPFGFSELAAGLCCVALHLWKHNNLLSIGGSTLLYMFLVQAVF